MVSERLEARVLQSRSSISLSEVIRYGGYALDLYLDSIRRVVLTQEERTMRKDSLDSLYLPQRFQAGMYLSKGRAKDDFDARVEGIDNRAIAYYFWRNFIESGSGHRSWVNYTTIRSRENLYTLAMKTRKFANALYNLLLVYGKVVAERLEQETTPQSHPLKKQIKLIKGGKK